MKWLTPLALLTAVAAATAKPKLVRPSQRVDLIYPADTVNLHQVFSVGVADNSPAAISGLQENVTISLTWPNGTRADLITAVNNCTPSAGLSGAYTANVNATDVGSFIATWNFTFVTSADPSQANGSFCGPGPYSVESLLLNTTFAVKDLGKGLVAQPTTVETKLPSQPTGLVKSSASRVAFTLLPCWIALLTAAPFFV